MQCAQLLRHEGFGAQLLEQAMAKHPGIRSILQLDVRNRQVWAVCTGAEEAPAWSPATHAFYPTRFRAALRTLLLAAHRQRRRQPAIAEVLSLPELRAVVMAHATQPVGSLWAEPGASG